MVLNRADPWVVFSFTERVAFGDPEAFEALARSLRDPRRSRRVLVDGSSLHLRTEVALACCAAKNDAPRHVPPFDA
jgi:hypothetical protein